MLTPLPRIVKVGALLSLGVLLAACNLPAVQTTATLSPTSGTGTPSPIPATDTPSPIPATSTPIPATDTPALTPTATACKNSANFVADVTVPDGTNFTSGESFVKTWRLKNNGSCPWTSQYQLVFTGGDRMSAAASKALPSRVAPGDSVDLSVNLQAPASNGTYRALWMLQDPNGQTFGIGSQAQTAFWVEITVGPTVHATGQLTVSAGDQVELDSATIGGGGDLLYQQVTDTEYYLAPQGSTLVTNWGSSVPSYSDCKGAGMSGDSLQLGAEFNQGDIICFQTNSGRTGRLEIESISGPTPPQLKLDIRTWSN